MRTYILTYPFEGCGKIITTKIHCRNQKIRGINSTNSEPGNITMAYFWEKFCTRRQIVLSRPQSIFCAANIKGAKICTLIQRPAKNFRHKPM
tara:strand:- start:544 stop:819 length:276 start_codon:yes stop_codon:yes gene_type:complete